MEMLPILDIGEALVVGDAKFTSGAESALLHLIMKPRSATFIFGMNGQKNQQQLIRVRSEALERKQSK